MNDTAFVSLEDAVARKLEREAVLPVDTGKRCVCGRTIKDPLAFHVLGSRGMISFCNTICLGHYLADVRVLLERLPDFLPDFDLTPYLPEPKPCEDCKKHQIRCTQWRNLVLSFGDEMKTMRRKVKRLLKEGR